jgi:hypothetical protein
VCNIDVNFSIMCCDDEAVAVSVLLEMKQTERTSFNPNFKQAEEVPSTTEVAGCPPRDNVPLLELEQHFHSGKRNRQNDCRVGSKSHSIKKKSRPNVRDAKSNDSKHNQAGPLRSPISVTSNLPTTSTAQTVPVPSLPYDNLLPCTFDALMKPLVVLPNQNLAVEKSETTLVPRFETSNSVAYVPAADVSVQMLQQLFSLVNLLSPQELASALLVAELEKIKAQTVTKQQADLGSFVAFLPILMPLLQQQFQTFGKPANPMPHPKLDMCNNNAAMTWLASLLLQSCSNTLS